MVSYKYSMLFFPFFETKLSLEKPLPLLDILLRRDPNDQFRKIIYNKYNKNGISSLEDLKRLLEK